MQLQVVSKSQNVNGDQPGSNQPKSRNVDKTKEVKRKIKKSLKCEIQEDVYHKQKKDNLEPIKAKNHKL